MVIIRSKSLYPLISELVNCNKFQWQKNLDSCDISKMQGQINNGEIPLRHTHTHTPHSLIINAGVDYHGKEGEF